jgi:polyhydroxybutyrate depolymerase
MSIRTEGVGTVSRLAVDVHGRRRTFTAITSATEEQNAPLVLVLPGSFQTGAGFRRFSGYAFDRFAAEAGAIVVYLDGYRRNWGETERPEDGPWGRRRVDDRAFVTAVIDQFATTGRADPARVFVVGFSAGGWMVMRLLREIPERLAGAAVLSGGQEAPGATDLDGAPSRTVPVIFFHGTADRQVPYEGGRSGVWRMRPGPGGLSTQAMVANCAALNGIEEPPTTVLLPQDSTSDPTSIERTEYRQDGRAPVVLYSVIGGGHVVPGPKRATPLAGRTTTRLDAAGAIGEFFGLLPAIDSE